MAIALNANKEVSFLKTCINGINALSGIGILSIPYALSSGGWLSLIILLIIATSAYFTAVLIGRCLNSNPLILTYVDIVSQAFGRKGRIIASCFICLELYFVATGLLILEGDNLHKLSPDFAFKFGGFTMGGRHSFVIIAGLMILPSMWVTDMGALSYISAGGVLSSLILVVCVLCVGTVRGVEFHGKRRLINLKGIPTALSLYTFCYGSHAMLPAIYSPMRRKSQFFKVLLISFVVCTITYLSMAVLGFLIYGHEVQSQVTLNLPTEMLSSKIAIYTIVLGPIAKYALTVMPIASTIISLLPIHYQDSRSITILIRMVLLTSTAVLAIVFPSFQSLVSLVGALLIVSVSFLLPCICYLKIFRVHKTCGLEFASIISIMLMTILVGIMGTYSSVSETVKHA